LIDFIALGARLKLSLDEFVLALLSFASAGGKTMSDMHFREILYFAAAQAIELLN
jgi:hypothetical protein